MPTWRSFRTNMSAPLSVHVPDDDLAELAATGRPVADRVEDHVMQLADLPVERLAMLAAACVPVVDLAVAVAGREEVARGMKRHGKEMSPAQRVLRDRFGRVQLPDVQARGRDPGDRPPVGRE